MPQVPTAESTLKKMRPKSISVPKITNNEEMVLPNNSGDHLKGLKRQAPTNDYDLANKKYVDDNAGVALGETSTTAYRGDRGKTAYDHSQDNTQAHTDYLLNGTADAGVGLTLSADNSTVDLAYVPMIAYDSDDSPPAASGYPVGTLFVTYTP